MADEEEYFTRTDIDLDIWRYGRNAATGGKLDNKSLRASYPYVEYDYKKGTEKIQKILKENFERNHLDQEPYLLRFSCVFFQTKEDALLFEGLLYVY